MSLAELIKIAEMEKQKQIITAKKPATTTPQKTRFNSRPYER